MTDLILPNRHVAEMMKATEGKGKIVGLTPWRDRMQYGQLGKAATKRGRWADYYDMYKSHPIVRAAIDKIAETATNVGYDFVPRDSRAKNNESELTVLKAFFSKQDNFIYELRRIYTDLLIYGDAFLYIVPDRRRNPTKLKRLSPKTLHIEANKNGKIIAYYQKNLEDISDDPVRFEPQEILHFMIADPDNDLYGLSPLESLRWAVTADIYAQRYNAAFFANSGVTGTIIGVRNANPDELQRNRKWLEEHYTGPENAHKPIVIEGESITIEKAVATHTEMGFLDGRRFITMEILAVLDVPPAKIGIMESANRSNSKEQDKSFRTESVSPLQNIVQNVINDQFVRKILGVEEMVFAHSEGDTRDAIEQMDYFTKGEAWGVFNPNEVRSKLGMAPVEGGDTNFIMTPTGAVPLDRMQLYFQIPKPNTDNIPATKQDPPQGEKLPTRTIQSSTASRSNTAKSFELHPALAAQGALLKLAQEEPIDRDLRQAYSYLNDAEILGDARISYAKEAIRKAFETNDMILRKGYVERAQETMGQFIVPYNDTIHDMQNTLSEVDDDD